MENILVTGCAGFIGSNFVRMMLNKYPEYRITNLDKLTYAGNLNNTKDFAENKNYTFVKGDICDKELVERVARGKGVFINFAAETHVDRSIIEAGVFARTDVIGTQTLLEAATRNDSLFFQISTDEVYGSTLGESFTEESPLNPSSPYSASKAGADLLVKAYEKTYGLKTLITRSSNNYGPFQHPEKLIPRFITNLLQGKKVPVYGDGLNVRDWLFVEDNCEGIDTVLHKGKPGQIYNIGGDCEKTNLYVTKKILQLLAKGEESIEYVEDRKGHDRRYSLSSERLHKLGWKPKTDFDEDLKLTVEWYVKNEWWWKPLV
ncbi:MAG: dTDP-glucose 4,6-dehydratase [Candidatus Aenigmarchaeota archaeon]|nr:dTDP-glucose 4,6-dehydratase [Candidatus Aenigmarchaeota archaeon]MBI5229676.1 dTDP-glucose 4,6-dehydratase [Candidatus Micrarchaeota archaeon]